ncbi:hypothetical protein EDC04DRAFT_2769900 [Pisolithus marmoratus]|nr:hypothetical protein EDC04DRAFT_2769900 [Pisolithus marmoratus]
MEFHFDLYAPMYMCQDVSNDDYVGLLSLLIFFAAGFGVFMSYFLYDIGPLWYFSQVPAIYHTCPTLRMPTLSTSRKHSMESIAEHGIGCLLVFEYLYFWLQGSKARNDLQKNLTWAVEEYQTSGTQDKVHECIKAAFKQHGDSVDVLCPTLMEIAKKYQMSKKLNGDG